MANVRVLQRALCALEIDGVDEAASKEEAPPNGDNADEGERGDGVVGEVMLFAARDDGSDGFGCWKDHAVWMTGVGAGGPGAAGAAPVAVGLCICCRVCAFEYGAGIMGFDGENRLWVCDDGDDGEFSL